MTKLNERFIEFIEVYDTDTIVWLTAATGDLLTAQKAEQYEQCQFISAAIALKIDGRAEALENTQGLTKSQITEQLKLIADKLFSYCSQGD